MDIENYIKDYEEYYEYYKEGKRIFLKYWEVAETYAEGINWLYVSGGVFVILFGIYLLDSMTENKGQGKMLLYLAGGLVVVWVSVAIMFSGLYSSGGQLGGN